MIFFLIHDSICDEFEFLFAVIIFIHLSWFGLNFSSSIAILPDVLFCEVLWRHRCFPSAHIFCLMGSDRNWNLITISLFVFFLSHDTLQISFDINRADQIFQTSYFPNISLPIFILNEHSPIRQLFQRLVWSMGRSPRHHEMGRRNHDQPFPRCTHRNQIPQISRLHFRSPGVRIDTPHSTQVDALGRRRILHRSIGTDLDCYGISPFDVWGYSEECHEIDGSAPLYFVGLCRGGLYVSWSICRFEWVKKQFCELFSYGLNGTHVMLQCL